MTMNVRERRKEKKTKAKGLLNQESIRKPGNKLEEPENIGSGHHQTNGDKIRNKKEVPKKIKKTSGTKCCSRNLISVPSTR